MELIDSISSYRGRQILQKIFTDLKYKKQLPAMSILADTWKICVSEKELTKFSDVQAKTLHTLGFRKGAALWLSEIINRHYFSAINSFVYFGAAILLVLIGVRRFSDHVSPNLVIAGVVFEALMLLLMFVVMFFSPTDDIEDEDAKEGEAHTQELISEIGEVGRDLAAAVIQLEQINITAQSLVSFQEKVLQSLDNIAQSFAAASAPNPKLVYSMKETNEALAQFNEVINQLSENLKNLKKEEIEFEVKKQLEKIITERVKFNAEA